MDEARAVVRRSGPAAGAVAAPRRRRRVAASLALSALLALVACSPGNQPPEASFDTDAAPPAERPLVVVWDADLGDLDPADTWCDACASYFDAVYEGLLAVGPDGGELVGRLARSWSASPDQREFTFELDPAARFADGTPVEAADVAWSWGRVVAAEGPAALLLEGLDAVEATGPRTVVARFDGPNSDFPAIATSPYLGVLNRDQALALAPPGSPEGTVGLARASVGSGPYVLEGYAEREQLRLARNGAYWGDAPAGFAHVVLRDAPTSSERRDRLESGEADVAVQLSAEVADRIEPSGDLAVVQLPSAGLVYLALSPGASGAVPLTDDVRRAVARDLDRAAVLDAVADDEGQVATSVIPPGFPGGGPADGAAPPPGAGAAPARLADPVVVEGGFPTTIVDGVDLADVADEVERRLADVGVEASLRPLDPAAWAAAVDGPGLAVTVAHAAPTHPGSSQFVRLFGLVPGAVWGARAGGGDPLVEEAEVDLFDEALSAEGAAQDGPYQALAEAIDEDAVIVPLFRPDVFLAHRTDVTGVAPSTCCPLDLRSLALRP